MVTFLHRPSLLNFLIFKAAAGSAAFLALFIVLSALPGPERPNCVIISAALLGFSGLTAFQAVSLLAGQPEGVGRFARRHIPILHVLSTWSFYLGSFVLVGYFLIALVLHGAFDMLTWG